MSWAEVTEKFLEILQKPQMLSIILIGMILIFLLSVLPSGLMAWIQWDGNSKIVSAIRDSAAEIKEQIRISQVANRYQSQNSD